MSLSSNECHLIYKNLVPHYISQLGLRLVLEYLHSMNNMFYSLIIR